MDAYFTTDDGEWFAPTEFCRGPWDAEACHAGPPTGLLVRAMERALVAAGSAQRLTRVTVDLLRPVPMAGVRVTAEVLRASRSVSLLRAKMTDAQGKERCVASGMAMGADLDRELPTAPAFVTALDSARPGPFVFERTLHGLGSFTDSVTLRYPPGEDPSPGPTTVWMRALPLLADEEASAWQRICPLADCGNALSRNAEPWEVGFVNTDLTIVLHRDPQGEWLGSRSVSHWQPSGVGLAHATLFDAQGAVGVALQSLLLRPALP